MNPYLVALVFSSLVLLVAVALLLWSHLRHIRLRERLNQVLDLIPHMVFARDRDGRFLFANRATAEAFGVEVERIKRTGIGDFHLSEQEVETILDDDRTIIDSGVPLFIPAEEFVTADGRELVMQTTKIPYRERGSRKQAVLGIAVDITARMQAFRALQVSEERYRHVVEDQEEFIVRWKPDGIRTFVNPSYCRYFGKSAEELLGKSFLPGLPEGLRRISSLTPEAPSSRAVEKAILPDGSKRWQQWTDRGTFDEQGELAEIQSVGRDITDLKEIEEALRSSESRYRSLVESFPDIVFITDFDRRMLFANPALERVTGLTLADFAAPLERNPFIHDDDHERVRHILAEFIRSDRIRSDPFESRFIDARGRQHWLSSVVTKVTFGGRPALQYVARDLTKRVEAEQSLLESQRQLRALAAELVASEERERNRIATYLHDQIGQSLSVARMKLGAIRKAETAPNLSRDLTEVLGLVERAIEDTQTATFELSPPILHQLGLVAALDWLGEEIERDHDLAVAVRAVNDPGMLEPDLAALLYRAVRELLHNVVKHAGAGRVLVEIRTDGGDLCIMVEDDGKGFDPELRPGGWGLFSIRERLNYLGGQFRVESGPGEGAKFEIAAPLPREGSREEP